MKKANAEWLYRARWGVFDHYLAAQAGDGRHASLVTPEEIIIGYTKAINNQDGTVSWDVPLTRKGLIEPEFMEPLARLGRDVPRKTKGGKR